MISFSVEFSKTFLLMRNVSFSTKLKYDKTTVKKGMLKIYSFERTFNNADC